jgi:carboxypeptidase family protein
MRSIRTLLVFAAIGVLSQAEDKKKPDDAGTVISGSVFRDPGYALPEATVTLVFKDDPKHKKLAQLSTTYRGEFSFHVPSTPAVYVVKASAKGFRAEEKEAAVTGPDRVDLTFTLEPETKK